MDKHALARRRFIGLAPGLGLLSLLPASAKSKTKVSSNNPVTAVCFGSGSLHGYAHIGAVRAFEALGFKPNLICGTSVGAIIGVLWAAGLTAREIEETVLDNDRFKFKMPRLPQLGLGTLDELESLIEKVTGNASIESLPTKFAAIATDLDTGELIQLSRGPAGKAVAASASIPLRYEPTVINGKRLVDGALSEPVPVLTARALGADQVVAIDVAYRPYEGPVSGFIDVAFQMFHIMVNKLIDKQISQADLGITMDVHEITQNDDVHINLIAAGEQAVHEKSHQLLELLGSS